MTCHICGDLLTKQCHNISCPPARQTWPMPQVPPRARITKMGLGRPLPVAKEEFKTPLRRATVPSGLEKGAGIPVWCVGNQDSCSIDSLNFKSSPPLLLQSPKTWEIAHELIDIHALNVCEPILCCMWFTWWQPVENVYLGLQVAFKYYLFMLFNLNIRFGHFHHICESSNGKIY